MGMKFIKHDIYWLVLVSEMKLSSWPVWFNRRAFARDPKNRRRVTVAFCAVYNSYLKVARVRISAGPLPDNSLGQAAHTHVPLSPSSIIWYRPMGGDALRLGR